MRHNIGAKLRGWGWQDSRAIERWLASHAHTTGAKAPSASATCEALQL